MSRTIAALYDTRAEAETARALLIEQLKVKPPTIVGRDTLGAIDGFKFDRKDADTYRDGVRGGAYLLVTQVGEGASAKQIVGLLQAPVTGEARLRDDEPGRGGDEQGVEFAIADGGIAAKPSAIPAAAEERAPRAAPAAAPHQPMETARETPQHAAAPIEEASIPIVREELRVGKQEVVRGGARVRSFTRETPAEEQVSLQEEVVEVENRPSDRRLSDSDLEAGGLFKERVFEIAEMREEPVVTKVAVVREEVIVRKSIKERTETIRDTVRHTEVEVEDLSGTESPALFGEASGGRTTRP